MSGVIIGIHGLANKPDKLTLASWWEASIREGLFKNWGIQDADFQYIMVYWADLLYKYPQHQDASFAHDSLYNKQPYVEAAQGALRRYHESWLDKLRAPLGAVLGKVLEKARTRIGWHTVADWILDQKFIELAYYYDEDRMIRDRKGQHRQARQVLMDELMNALVPLNGQKIMLIAHSMGSIIAYDVLRNLGQQDHSFAVQHFSTIGSPLGLPHVKANIHSERSYASVPVRTPTVVRESWVNYADNKDPVAVDAHLRDDFGPNGAGVRVEDDMIANDYTGPGGEKNTHKSYGYLRTPELSRRIRDFLEQ